MGIKSSRSNSNRQKSQVIHYSQLANSGVQFSTKQKSSHSYFLNTTVSFKHQQLQIEDYLNNLVKNGNLIDTSNLYMPLGWQKQTGLMCQQIKDLQLYYPIYSYFLRNQMEARKATSEGFSEPQIWYMLMSILNGLRQFQKINLISTPLTVDSIRMNQEGLIKILNCLSTPKLYEQIIDQKRHRSSPLDFQVQQTYKLGLILLQVCTFSGMHFPSNVSSFSLNQLLTERYVKFMSLNYSDLLCTLVSVMLSSFTDRPLPSQIYQIFVPFKKQIMNFKPFDFNVSAMRNSITQSRATIPNGAFSMYMSNQIQKKAFNSNCYNNQDNIRPNYRQNTKLYSPKTTQMPQRYQQNNNYVHLSNPGQKVNHNVFQNSNHYLSPISYQNRSPISHF